ncbi:MAG: hypothetical protein JF616_08475 [Fibrobacteres bacterium]|nr:hypothetical protein [Fibrobacterota bacterium]
MKSFRLLLIAAACAAFVGTAQARMGGNFGLGFIAGLPSGLSGKLWLNNTNAVDMILGFNPSDDWLQVRADYVWHEFNLFPVSSGQLPLYYGMGAGTEISGGGLGLLARGVVGIEYLFPRAPLDAFFEIGPGIRVFPRTDFDMSAGLGMRYYF